ncbi:MAG: glycosyltransferase family 39 protein [Anaerolineales bacterium]
MFASAPNDKLTRGQRLVLLVGLILSLFLRLWRIDEFITIDEHNWRTRSIEFYQGLVSGDYIQTCRTEHPGVITMWAGVGGYLLSQQLEQADVQSPWLRHVLYPLDHDQGTGLYPETMWARRIIALVTWLGIVGLFFLGRHLLSPTANLFATLFLALDPFYLAYSRLHHLDALLACFMALSLGALLVYAEGGKRRYLLLSGAMAALATLNKAPGVFLAVGMAGILGWYAWRRRGERQGWWRRWLADALLWAVAALAVGFALWPALWVSPRFAFQRVLDGVWRQASNPHEKGNFFLSMPVEDPGVFFYPVAWLLRTTPFILAGLLGLLLGDRNQRGRAPAQCLLFSALAYTLFMTASLKKFDRYLLPVFPLLCVPAGLGWERLVNWGRARWHGRQWLPTAVSGITVMAYLAMLLPARPYYTSYYNPLVGGAAVAPRVLLVGWGEGMEQAARYLNTKPDAQHLHVSCIDANEFEPFFLGYTTPMESTTLVDPDYFVTYISYLQRDYMPEVTAELKGQKPEFVARAPNGLAYAWVYANHVLEDEINSVLDLVAAEPGGGLIVLNTSPAAVRRSTLDLDVIRTERRDALLTELQWQRGKHAAAWLVTFPGVHDESTARLHAVLTEVATRDRVVERDGVLAERYVLSDRLLAAEGETGMHYRLGDQIDLLGYDGDVAAVDAGDTLTLGLHWQAQTAIAADYKVFIHVVDEANQIVAQDDSMPQGNTRATTTWHVGEVVLDEHSIALPDGLPAGRYQVYLGMYELATMQRLPIVDKDGLRVADDRLLIATIEIED